MDTSSNKLILISKLLLLTIPWKAVHFELTFLCQMFQLQTKLNSLCFGSVSLTRRGDSVTKTAKKSSRNCLNFCPWGSRRDPETPSVTQTSVLNAPADLHHLCRSRRLLGALEHLLPVGLVLDVFTPVANVCRLERMRRTRQHLKLRPNILYFLYFMLEPITFNLLGWSNWKKAKYVQTIKTKLIWKLNETKLTSK